MEKDLEQKKMLVYQLMNDELDLEKYVVPESRVVKNEFDKGAPCNALYDEVFRAKMRLCERLHVPEDADIEMIIMNLLEIGQIQCMKMYDYGQIFLKKEVI